MEIKENQKESQPSKLLLPLLKKPIIILEYLFLFFSPCTFLDFVLHTYDSIIYALFYLYFILHEISIPQTNLQIMLKVI